MNQEKSTCNPLELWPTRSYKKLRVKRSSTKGGYHDGINGEVVVPIANDAYSRTVRMHEAGHSLFSKREIRCDDAVAQGIEDARVHTLINTQGTAARDELSTAIRDLHVPEAHTVNRALACIISLRSGAILFKDAKGSKAGSLRTASWLRAVKRLQRMAGVIGPKFYGSLREALELLEDGDQWQRAEDVIRTAVKLANTEAEKKAAPKAPAMPKAPAPKTDGEPMPAPPKLDGDEEPTPEDDSGAGEASDGEAEPEGEASGDTGKGSGKAEEGKAEDGEAEDGKAEDGEAEDGKAEDGEAEDGKAEDGKAEDDGSFAHVGLSSASDSLGEVPKSTFTKKTLVVDKTEIKKGVYATADLEELSKGITKEAAALLSESSKESIDSVADTFPTLNIVPIFKSDPVRAQVGSTVHHSIAGARIDAKKLSLVITPGTHRIFTKKKRSNGGTIVIDASGSMQFDLEDLEAILLEAPVATIAFYNAKSDHCKSGNLWIFAYRGKRAKDLTGPGLPKADKDCTGYFKRYGRWPTYEDKSVPGAQRWGYGNVVDFQVCEWLLAQPKPRYFVTDKNFVGSSRTSNEMALELTQRAEDAGLLQCVWSPDHKKSPKYTFELLRGMLARNAGK